MKRKKTAAFLCVFCLILFGCQKTPEPMCQVVTEISISYQDGPIHAKRHYTDTEKTREILNYIRQLDPYGKPEENPETADGSEYVITLFHSDGCQQVYRQKGNRFFQGLDGMWRKIDPQKAEKLSWIMGKTRSDLPAFNSMSHLGRIIQFL